MVQYSVPGSGRLCFLSTVLFEGTLYVLECDGPWKVMPGDRTQEPKAMHWLYDAFLGTVCYRQTH